MRENTDDPNFAKFLKQFSLTKKYEEGLLILEAYYMSTMIGTYLVSS